MIEEKHRAALREVLDTVKAALYDHVACLHINVE